MSLDEKIRAVSGMAFVGLIVSGAFGANWHLQLAWAGMGALVGLWLVMRSAPRNRGG